MLDLFKRLAETPGGNGFEERVMELISSELRKHPSEVTELDSSVVRPTLLYINSEAVIPVPYQVRDELQRESSSEILDSPVSSTGQA